MKDKGTAAILAFFLGGLGIHRFCLGQTGLGIVYLLFCWTPIIWIIAVIDFLAFLLGSKAGFDRKYNSVLMNQNNNQPVVQNQVHVYHQSPNGPVGQQVQTGISSDAIASNSGPKSNVDDLEKLEKLHNMKERGIISEDEFAIEKAKILKHQRETPPDRPASNDPFLG